MKYLSGEYFHEAGYDSYLTARVMILLSVKLEAEGMYVGEIKRQQAVSDDEAYLTPPEENGGVSLQSYSAPSPSLDLESSDSVITATNDTASLLAPSALAQPKSDKKKKRKAKKDDNNPANATSTATG